MPTFALDASLYWASLGVSAAAVLLFLWLMRERKSRDGSGR